MLVLASFALSGSRSCDSSQPTTAYLPEQPAYMGFADLQDSSRRMGGLELCQPYDKGCLSAFPASTVRIAAFSIENHDGPQTAVLLSSASLNIQVVDRLPADVVGSALIVKGKTPAKTIAKAKTLVFYGDVRVDVGELAGKDQMLSVLRMKNSTVRDFRIGYKANGVRGPPDVVTVYVVGTLKRVDHPDQKEQSYLSAAVIDLDLREGRWASKKVDAKFRDWNSGDSPKTGDLFPPTKREYDPPEYHPPEYHPPEYHPASHPVF